MMQKKEANTFLKKVWYFIWYDDGFLSWIVNAALAFIIIKFIVYPGLGFILATSHPVVAVVSSSMEHDASFDPWWLAHGGWYTDRNITKEEFLTFQSKNGFNKGDIMILHGKEASKIEVGDILVFKSSRPDPIIHRVVKKWTEEDKYLFQTKGDNNPKSIEESNVNEGRISSDRIIGVAAVRIPFLGWIKIIAVSLMQVIVGR